MFRYTKPCRPICTCGGIGRRNGLKIRWRISPWRFKSSQVHQIYLKGLFILIRLEVLQKVPTVKLIELINDASNKGEQDLINIYAYEIACRIWVPNEETTFEELLKNFLIALKL